jgi:hypothetical protein
MVSSLQKAGIFSFFLHTVIILLLTFPPFVGRKPPVRNSRQIIVNFVKIGPKSAAPMLGPQTVQAPKKIKDNARNQLTPPKAQPPAASTKKEILPPAKATLEKRSEVPLPPKPLKAPKPLKPPKEPAPKKSNIKAVKNAVPPPQKGKVEKNRSQHSPQASISKAKVDLLKKGTAAQSIGDFFGKKPAATSVVANTALAETLGEELTGTDIDLLNSHMKRFWNMPSGHKKAHGISVEVELIIRKDGTIEQAKIVEQSRLRSDPEFRIAAESAMRAVLEPGCSPLPLDPSKYEKWKHMIFVFDPSEMCH